jgi:signal transduction histidine kinase
MTVEKPTILYVDDLHVNLKLFKEALKKDYEIILSETPHEALNILDEKEVQVIVSDQRMPEMTGTELLEIVAEKYPNIGRFLLTAYTDAETVIEAVNVGRIHGYMKKPMNANEIRSKINRSLELYYLRKRNAKILEELEEANAALRGVDGLKSELINAISSEISPPLNRIMGTLHLLKSRIEGDELTEVVNILDQSVLKLDQFSMLAQQISILKSPGYSLEKGPVPMKQIMQYSSIETKEELKESNMGLDLTIEPDDYAVEGDAELLASCLTSLILYAKEHTAGGDNILIKTLPKHEERGLQIIDGGSNYSEALFSQLKYQFSTSSPPLNLSMGIGLAVAQIIMEAHGGQLLFEKTADNKGKMKMLFSDE